MKNRNNEVWKNLNRVSWKCEMALAYHRMCKREYSERRRRNRQKKNTCSASWTCNIFHQIWRFSAVIFFQTLSREFTEMNTEHIMIKMSKAKDKKSILKAARKMTHHVQRNSNKINNFLHNKVNNFLPETREARGSGIAYSKYESAIGNWNLYLLFSSGFIICFPLAYIIFPPLFPMLFSPDGF